MKEEKNQDSEICKACLTIKIMNSFNLLINPSCKTLKISSTQVMRLTSIVAYIADKCLP